MLSPLVPQPPILALLAFEIFHFEQHNSKQFFPLTAFGTPEFE
jgi:hypothetical protein